MALLILSLTASYAQRISGDSVVLGPIEAEYFANQNSKAEYLEVENQDLNYKDSLKTAWIANYRNIVHINDSIIADYGQIEGKCKNVIKCQNGKIIELSNLNTEQEQKIKFKNKTIGGAILIIIFEAAMIILKF